MAMTLNKFKIKVMFHRHKTQDKIRKSADALLTIKTTTEFPDNLGDSRKVPQTLSKAFAQSLCILKIAFAQGLCILKITFAQGSCIRIKRYYSISPLS